MLIKFDPPPELPSLSASPRPPQTFPFGETGPHLYFSGRYALFAALSALGLPEGAEVLLPAYNCGTEIEPHLRAGLRPRFWRVGRDLACDLDHIADLMRRGSGPRALLLTHYFGLPQPVAELYALCRVHGVSLIEDCAHALLSDHAGRPLGSWGQAAVFSLIKALPLPDGGALVMKDAATSESPPAEPPTALTQHTLARLLRHNHPGDGGLATLSRLALERALAARRLVWERLSGRQGLGLVDPRSLEFNPQVSRWRMSRLSRRILASLDLARVKDARRRNFAALLAHFQARHPGCLLLGELPEGACPLCFPVRLRQPPELFARLMAGWGVEACPWWRELHPAVPWGEFPEAAALKRRLLALPVHQGLGETEMERVAAAFEAAWRLLA